MELGSHFLLGGGGRGALGKKLLLIVGPRIKSSSIVNVQLVYLPIQSYPNVNANLMSNIGQFPHFCVLVLN